MAYKQNGTYSFSNDLGITDTTTTPSYQTKIRPINNGLGKQFGESVAVGSGKIVVGEIFDSPGGSAYIFDLDGTNETKITASDAVSGDDFGCSVAVGSGKIVVGAKSDNTNKGSAYIFDLDGTNQTKITGTDTAGGDQFGCSVAVGSGKIVVGAIGDDDNGGVSGSAYIFDLNGTQLAKLTASDGAGSDQFGTSVAIGNGKIVVGAPYNDDNGTSSGSAYIFDLGGIQLAKITASDVTASSEFGWSVAVGSGRIVVGAHVDDDNGTDSGSAYIFDLDGNQLTKITASDAAANDKFGSSVAVGNGRIVVGAWGENSNEGAVYIYDLDGNQLSKLSPAIAGDRFGGEDFGVAVGNGKIVAGAEAENTFTGRIYIYDTPSQTHYLDILD